MPSHSKHLWEEGMCTKSFKLVEKGIFQEEGLLYLQLIYPPYQAHMHTSMYLLFCIQGIPPYSPV